VEAAKRCTGAPLPPHHSQMPLYLAFAEAQTNKLEVCEERRALAVDAMALHNKAQEALAVKLAPRPWWKFWAR
jgi:hypothetical protein